jgi:hypothetical protein
MSVENQSKSFSKFMMKAPKIMSTTKKDDTLDEKSIVNSLDNSFY